MEVVTKAGIAIDPWKEDIFKSHLMKGGYNWTRVAPFPGCVTLMVETTDPEALARVIHVANNECAQKKKTLHN